jgi:hypothetical protein
VYTVIAGIGRLGARRRSRLDRPKENVRGMDAAEFQGTEGEIAMNEEESMEGTLDDLVIALTEEAEWLARSKPTALFALVASVLSDLFGSAPGSSSWH